MIVIGILFLINIVHSFKTMNITISNTGRYNIIDKNCKPKYFISNELKFVSPYVYTYKLYTKKRWVGKEIEKVLNAEFGAYGNDYFKTSIKKGYIKVNKKNIFPNYIMKDNDLIEHTLLLFEKPVLYKKVLILYEDDNFVCVHKPISMPTHPVGSYQYNSLLRILQNYFNFQKLKNKNNQIEEDLKNPEFEDVVKVNFLFNFKKVDLKTYEEQMKNNLEKRKLRKRSYRERKRSNKERKSTTEDLNFLCNDLKKKIKSGEQHNGDDNSKTLQDDKKIVKEDIFYENHLTNDIMKTDMIEGEIFKKSNFHLNLKNSDQETDQNNNISTIKTDIHGNKTENKKVMVSVIDALQSGDKRTNHAYDKSGKEEAEKEENEETEKEKEDEETEKEKEDEETEEKEEKEKDSLNNTNENTIEGDMYMYTLHRLDKYTSGIALFGKNKAFSTAFAQNLSANKIKKTYITRVDGDFRKLIKKMLVENKILRFEERDKLKNVLENFCKSNKKKSFEFFESSKCSEHSDERKINQTGENNSEDILKNDQFLYENKYKNESIMNEGKMKKLIDKVKTQKKQLEDFFDINKYSDEYFSAHQTDNDTKCQIQKHVLTEANMREDTEEDDIIYHKYFVVDLGYMFCQSKKTLKYVFVKEKEIYDNRKYKEESSDKKGCHVINDFNDSNDSADFSLKPTVTKFMFLSYNEKIDESLIICQPITGRTHQIRAHLESLNYPISNDPSYNKKFKEEYLTKSKYLHFMNPYFENIMHLDNIITEEAGKNEVHEKEQNINVTEKKTETKSAANASEKYNIFPLIPFLNTSFNWLFDDSINLHNEYEYDFLKNYFFKKISNVSYHSSGIFLHSCRYSWDTVFDVFTLIPNWCAPFRVPADILTFLTYGNIS